MENFIISVEVDKVFELKRGVNNEILEIKSQRDRSVCNGVFSFSSLRMQYTAQVPGEPYDH